MQVYKKNISQKAQDTHTEPLCAILKFEVLQSSQSISLPMADEWNHTQW